MWQLALSTITKVEEVKHVATCYFCRDKGHSVEVFYDKIFSIAYIYYGAMNGTSYDDVEATMIPSIQERVQKTKERLEADFSKIESKIHRFPQGLRWIEGEGDRYIVPSFVALGPYHHGLPHLKKTEELKHAAAHYLCMKSGHSVQEVYGKVLSVAGEDRGLYEEDAVKEFSEAEFAEMMFLDGCFLLHHLAMTSFSDLFDKPDGAVDGDVHSEGHYDAGEPDPVGGARRPHELH
ncbi:hypothetical protein E2562_032796, partial [Oryza meyeriana var. granulata]